VTFTSEFRGFLDVVMCVNDAKHRIYMRERERERERESLVVTDYI